jgi:hypothetical protein
MTARPFPVPRAVIPHRARAILRQVSERYGIPVEVFCGRSRRKHLVIARHEAAVNLNLAGYSHGTIGRILALHPSSVWAAVHKQTLQEPIKFPDLSGEWAI